jgi:hypothetical protein
LSYWIICINFVVFKTAFKMKITNFKKPLIIATTFFSIVCFLFLSFQSSALSEKSNLVGLEDLKKVKETVIPDLAAIESIFKAVFSYMKAI